jgi:hypothetical protein
MRNPGLTRRRLLTYSQVAAALLCTEKLKAQIAYTNIKPDSVLDNMGEGFYFHEFVDLNNDGVFDIKLTSVFASSYTTGDVVKAYGENANRLLNSLGPYACICEAVADDYGDIINSSTSNHRKWRKNGYLTSAITPPYYWHDGNEHYLPVRLRLDGSTHYGWIRMKLDLTGNPLVIKDYAYNTLADEPITAGQTLPCGDGFENDNSFQKAKPLSTGHIYHALIDTTADLDFYKWVYTYDPVKPNVQISLYDLPKDYDLRLFDADKNLIAQSIQTGPEEERIFFNGTLSSGNYFIKVYPKTHSDFDAINCYTLQIGNSHFPYQKITESESAASEVSVMVSPNPAVDRISFMNTVCSILEIHIMDISGQELLNVRGREGQSTIQVDVSQLASGTYLARITSTEDVTMTKFIIEK